MLYELYVGEYLFYERDFTVFFKRLTDESYDIFNETFKEKLDKNLFLCDLIKYILKRNPEKRPNIKSIMKRLKAIFQILNCDIENKSKSLFMME